MSIFYLKVGEEIRSLTAAGIRRNRLSPGDVLQVESLKCSLGLRHGQHQDHLEFAWQERIEHQTIVRIEPQNNICAQDRIELKSLAFYQKYSEINYPPTVCSKQMNEHA